MILVLMFTVVFSFTGSSKPVSEKLNPTINISADNISYGLSDTLYGISLDNNGYALDGGLVSQLVNNNSFEYSSNPTAGWNIGSIGYTVATEEKMNENNENYLNVTVSGKGSAENFGYTEIFNNKSFQFNNRKAKTGDMGFVEGESYAFSAFFKNIDFVGTMSVSLNAEGNTEKYQFNIEDCKDWTKISLEIKSDVTADGSLVINFEGDGTFYMDSVSLIPVNSYGYSVWKYTSLRPDLYKAIKGLSPSFIRFYEDVAQKDETVFGWKDTIGPLETRVQLSTTYRDNDRFSVNSNSMGFYEYLLLCEDLGAIPVPVFDISIATEKEDNLEKILNEDFEENTNTEENIDEEFLPVPETEEYVQNILDFIEYATGDETTHWGAKRIEDGHEKPFDIKYIAIDDSQMNENYWSAFNTIYGEINAKYPNIQLVTSSGKALIGVVYDGVWKNLDATYKNVLVNEYFGSEKVSLYNNLHRFDDYERSGAKVTVESFASNADGIGSVITSNNIWSAIENTAFLTSVERNADVVQMASYKWILEKRNAQQGKMSLVWFDSQDILLSADYYSQMIFANNKGTNYISTDFDMESDGIYHSATVDTTNKVIYVKLVNTTNREYKFNINVDGFNNVNNPSVQYMAEKFKSAYNDFDEFLHVAPKEAQLTVEDNIIKYNMNSYSISVVRIPYDKNDGSGIYALPEMEIVSPYIHPMIENIVPIALVSLVLVTGVIILIVRITHHKAVRKDEE
ncbi:MAG: hypothetical protein J6Q50_03110 [Clostridia bacterium]|nr:hypothetical protein [Clostridia bacterium]